MITDNSLFVEQSNGFLSVNSMEGIFQWIKCDLESTPVSGAVYPQFQPMENGYYAVVATVGFCTDTSDCIEVSDVSVSRIETIKLSYYPNPVSQTINIELADFSKSISANIYDINGRNLLSRAFKNCDSFRMDVPFAPGVYFIGVSDGEMTKRFKILKL